ncbi:hypothetical protein ACPA9J_15670 [Pseudomonas aeruginosa]
MLPLVSAGSTIVVALAVPCAVRQHSFNFDAFPQRGMRKLMEKPCFARDRLELLVDVFPQGVCVSPRCVPALADGREFLLHGCHGCGVLLFRLL